MTPAYGPHKGSRMSPITAYHAHVYFDAASREQARALCEAARLLAYRVIDLRAKGRPPSADTNVARVAGTAAERAVSELALEMFGPEALEHGHFAESQFRLAMTAGVAVGTTEVNLNLVASRFLGLPRE